MGDEGTAWVAMRQLAEEIQRQMTAAGLTLAVAESCTGGLVGQLITSVSGSSAYFLGGVIAYSNDVKERLLGVDRRGLETYGAVSGEVVRQMARGVRSRLGADIGVAVTGIAGPGGGSEEKPVGLVFAGVDGRDVCEIRRYALNGDRRTIRDQAAAETMGLLAGLLKAGGLVSRP